MLNSDQKIIIVRDKVPRDRTLKFQWAVYTRTNMKVSVTQRSTRDITIIRINTKGGLLV